VNRALSSPPPAHSTGAAPVEAPILPSADPGEPRPMGIFAGLALVAEDDAGWRSILAELLTESGYRVRLCAGFGEALGVLRRERFAVAVIDLTLSPSEPPRDPEGYRLLISTHSAGIPTIVVTGTASPEAIQRAYLEYGVFACLEKRLFDRAAFRTTVDEARAANRANDLDVLTDREREVLELLAHGLTNREIADRLVITSNTVKRHLKSIFEKLEVHTRAAAAARAVVFDHPAGIIALPAGDD
jgi:DNA-binding NarL/FixJ family response regulator